MAERIRILLAVALLTVAPAAVRTPEAVAAPPAGLCVNADPAHPVIRELPWAQQALDPARVWQYSTGAGVLVAVIDSGVDADHPQLRAAGKVLPGEDFFQVGKLRANFDCDSHGTGVAGIIAADSTKGIGFRGVAPGARILPVRISDRGVTDGATNEIDPQVLARGIRYAADQGAKVINLSMAGERADPYVRSAVAYAQSRDALVVAAVGNNHRAGEPSRPSYPAAYDGVLGVGAIDISGTRLATSQLGPYVDLVAPGGAVVGATRRGGHTYLSGTSFAAPFVTGTAALVRAAWPKLTAAQVAARLLATADPARGGSAGAAYGAGVVDPYRAVTDGLSASRPEMMPPLVHPPTDHTALEAIATRHELVSAARGQTGIALAIGVLVLLAALILPSGLRRRWTPGRTSPLPADRPRDEPPDQLFLLPPPPAER